jgi:hypothetical protein
MFIDILTFVDTKETRMFGSKKVRTACEHLVRAEQLCRQQHIRESVLFKAAQQGPRI